MTPSQFLPNIPKNHYLFFRINASQPMVPPDVTTNFDLSIKSYVFKSFDKNLIFKFLFFYNNFISR